MKDDADYLAALIIRIASANTTLADAEWLKNFLVRQFDALVNRGIELGYNCVADEDVLVYALEELKL